MSDPELSPKALRLRRDAPPPAGSAFDSGSFFPFLDDAATSVTPLQLETQPTARDLMVRVPSPSPDDVILDPATPRTPAHQRAELQMTTGTAAQVLKKHMDAVVKVYTTHSRPNWELPWQRRQQTHSKSTGFCVVAAGTPRWILTNAHSVCYASQVQLKRRGDDERYEARVLAIGTDCDVALLTVEDDEFWREIAPLELGVELPELQDSVAVVGYPIGGDSLAISAGVVSRVQITHYTHGGISLLALQTDASVNSGNSGGPVLNSQGKVVGIAFQSLTGDAQLVGYVIPTNVVSHFLDDVRRHGRYTGFPALNIGWQELESKSLKRAVGVGPHQKGVLVRSVVAAADEARCLQVDDVLTRIAGTALGCDGSVPFRHGERVDFRYLVTSYFVGDEVELEVLRGGETVRLEVQLQPYQHLVPPHVRDGPPSFFMCGGLVFVACSDPYLIQRYGSLSNSPVRLMAKTYYGTKAAPGEEVVLLSNVLACAATMGYDATAGIRDSAVLAFNGEPVHNLKQLARAVYGCKEEYMRFDMEAGRRLVVMEAAAARSCTQSLCERESMAQPFSKDVQEALGADFSLD